MGKIQETFARLKNSGRTGLSLYVTVGFPDVATTMLVVPAMVNAGADIIELGVPFSDPLADGATIQRASQVALDQGVSLSTCLEIATALQEKISLVPLILMGYYNPILAYGLGRFARDAAKAGVDGVIVPDLPPEEAQPLRGACVPQGIDVIFLLAPTSTEERIKKVTKLASGFIYCVSLTGVTGARQELPAELPEFIARVRRHTELPLAVGFGISRGEQVRAIGKMADAVIVGSALITEIEKGDGADRAQRAHRFVAELSTGTHKV